MPEISRFYGIIIYLYVQDHTPPHIHAHYGEHHALFDIKKNELDSGKLPARAIRMVTKWIEIHHVELLKNWENAREEKEIFFYVDVINTLLKRGLLLI